MPWFKVRNPRHAGDNWIWGEIVPTLEASCDGKCARPWLHDVRLADGRIFHYNQLIEEPTLRQLAGLPAVEPEL